MQIKEVLDLEQAGQNTIHLHREGIFWRAYEYSAYLFATHVRAFKVSAKFIKAVKCEVVSLGFPDGLLEDNYFSRGKLGRYFELKSHGRSCRCLQD